MLTDEEIIELCNRGSFTEFGYQSILKLNARLADAERERDAMRPVVEAAEAWDDSSSPLIDIHTTNLSNAVDAYRAAKGGQKE